MLVCCSSAELFATVGVSFKVDCKVIQKLFDSNHKVWGTRTSAPVMFNASDPDGQSVKIVVVSLLREPVLIYKVMLFVF